MSLKLMYITNDPVVATIAENAGVDRIFVDMEYIGKSIRQGGMDTVQSHHTVSDVERIRKTTKSAELLVRINPIHEAGEYMGVPHCSSKEEIDAVIEAGADIIMLPYFKTVGEVQRFVELIDGRARTYPLLETPEAVEVLDEILTIPGIDEIHIGLNDLSLGYGRKFMFEILADGTVEQIVKKIKAAGIPFGIGGIAGLGKGMLPAEHIIAEHYNLGSTSAILSRSFCNTSVVTKYDEIEQIFNAGLEEIRSFEQECTVYSEQQFEVNRAILKEKVALVVDAINAKNK